MARLLALGVAAWLIVGCSDGIKVSSSYGPGIRFSGMGTTYRWREVPPEETAQAQEPNLHALIVDSINSSLADRGYTMMGEADEVDFLVEYRVALQYLVEKWEGTGFTEYEQGSLVVSVVDPESLQLIWRGVAQAKISIEDSPDVRTNRIQTAVQKIFDLFPAAEPNMPPDDA